MLLNKPGINLSHGGKKEKPVKLFLVGMMGSGKSYWTKWLSKKLKTGGYDLDFLIESNEEKPLPKFLLKTEKHILENRSLKS